MRRSLNLGPRGLGEASASLPSIARPFLAFERVYARRDSGRRRRKEEQERTAEGGADDAQNEPGSGHAEAGLARVRPEVLAGLASDDDRQDGRSDPKEQGDAGDPQHQRNDGIAVPNRPSREELRFASVGPGSAV